MGLYFAYEEVTNFNLQSTSGISGLQHAGIIIGLFGCCAAEGGLIKANTGTSGTASPHSIACL